MGRRCTGMVLAAIGLVGGCSADRSPGQQEGLERIEAQHGALSGLQGNTTIDFNGLPDGTVVNTQFQPRGVTFSGSEAGGPQARITGGAIPGPDYLCPGPAGGANQFNGTITLVFTSPVTSFSSSIADGPTTLTGFLTNGQTQTVSYAGGQLHAPLDLDPTAVVTKVVFTGMFYCIDFVSFRSGCQTNVARLSQGDPRWAANLYDHSATLTIKQKGCALTSLSMAFSHEGLLFDPDALNTFMAKTDTDYAGSSVNWGAATRDASGDTLKFHPTVINSLANLQAANQYLDATICQGDGHPVIVGVDLDDNGTPGHFVLVTGKDGTDYTINDPGYSNTTLSDYDNEFATRGFVADPPGDISELDLSVGDGTELLITSPAGLKTGFDTTSSRVLQGIPSSTYFRDALADDVTSAPPTETIHFAEISQPAKGTYQILVSGLKPTAFKLSVRVFSQDGSPQPDLLIDGVAGPGSSSPFTVQLNGTPGATSAVSRAATFPSTIGDIASSLAIGLIDNKGIANSLSQKIASAQGASNPARSNILQAFTSEVNAQAGKHVNGVAVQILLEDAGRLASQ